MHARSCRMLIYLLPACCCPAIRRVDHTGGGLRRGAHAGLVLRDGWVHLDAWCSGCNVDAWLFPNAGCSSAPGDSAARLPSGGTANGIGICWTSPSIPLFCCIHLQRTTASSGTPPACAAPPPAAAPSSTCPSWTAPDRCSRWGRGEAGVRLGEVARGWLLRSAALHGGLATNPLAGVAPFDKPSAQRPLMCAPSLQSSALCLPLSRSPAVRDDAPHLPGPLPPAAARCGGPAAERGRAGLPGGPRLWGVPAHRRWVEQFVCGCQFALGSPC